MIEVIPEEYVTDKFDISYVVSQLLFERDTDELRARMENYNQTLKQMAIAEGAKTYKQVSIEGPALLVDDIDL